MDSIYLTIVLAPLAGAIFAGLWCRWMERSVAHWVTIIGVAISCALSLYVLKRFALDWQERNNGHLSPPEPKERHPERIAELTQAVEDLLQRSIDELHRMRDLVIAGVGRYKLLQQIGEGGCGVVFMAEQEEPVRRKVALKVIKKGMDSRQVVATSANSCGRRAISWSSTGSSSMARRKPSGGWPGTCGTFRPATCTPTRLQ